MESFVIYALATTALVAAGYTHRTQPQNWSAEIIAACILLVTIVAFREEVPAVVSWGVPAAAAVLLATFFCRRRLRQA